MQKRKSFFNNELEQRFSLRKYTIGLCSVCLGFVVIGMGSQTVKADTVNDVDKSSAMQKNKAQDTNSSNTDALPESKRNTPDSAKAKPNTTPTETKEGETGSVDASKTNATSIGSNGNAAIPTEIKLDNANPAAANSNNALAQTKLVKVESAAQPEASGASTETKKNEHGSDVVNPNVVSTEVKPNAANPANLAKIKPQRIRLAKLVDTKALAESKVAIDNQFNFDDWTTQIDDTYLNITGYKGDRSKQIVVPNGADFAKAGKNDKNLQVEIDKRTLVDLIVDGVAPKLSNTDGQKIVANGSDWSDAFSGKNLYDISGLANLDIRHVFNMEGMFHDNQIRDLSPLANWNTDNVYYMNNMFSGNSISDLSPLANWNTHMVNNMSNMFYDNQIRDLSPLASWNTSDVFNMYRMFEGNQISDLSPLAKWNTRNVTDMGLMFHNNQIRDLSPLANWNIGKVRDMSDMFSENSISDLSPLASWNTSHVFDMSRMFEYNQISDLSSLAHWNTSNVTDMDDMFAYNPLNPTINSQSTLNKFHASIYKFDNIGALASHSESKTFNDSSQILLDKNVVTGKDSATLTFKANSSTGNTYQIKIYNPNNSIDIQAAALPVALGTTDTSYQNGYTIITNKFINNGSVKQDISITRNIYDYHDWPAFAQYESTSGLITVTKGKEDLGSINITYQNVTDFNNDISAPYIGKKPYINNTQNTFYFQPYISGRPNEQYSFIKSAELTITVPDDVTIDPDTFIDAKTGKTLKGTKIADHQYQAVLDNTTDGIAVKGLINVPADKLTNGTAHLPGFGMKYTINTYNDKVAPVVATGTSKELSVIPDLASYHGDLIKINQSKWAIDRNGNEVSAYYQQGFGNDFYGLPLEPAVSTKVTNGIETFDMPAGVNITGFNPKFNKDAIDHIDYIYTDGSTQTASSFGRTPKAIRQMKVYFKNGIQSDELFYNGYMFNLSFDTTYPDGTPIKNFDTFKITGSFSCDELGSANNIDVAQVMLAPTQKLTDGMLTDTSQNESNKTANASGNFINAIICNDNLPQHQGHLTNPIFYFKYNDLMVPDLSKISASYDNQNKELGSIGLTNIDNNKIHSSIITDNAGQKFVKVQIDGEYYYGGSFDHTSGFNVQIPISNTPDALSATKDWSWYILNNSDEAKTESTIRNSSQGNKLLSTTVDGNTLSVGGTGTWQIITAQGFTSGTETQGNLNGGPGLASTQDDHQQDPTHFTIYDSIINATDDAKSDLVSVANLPSTQDGKSKFNVQMTGKASLINVMTGQTYDAAITYSYGTGDNNFITGDQVTDWSKVKSIKVVPNGGAPSMTSLRLVVPVEDKTIYDDVGKTIYVSTMTYGEDKANTNYTTKDGFAVPEKSTILPIIIKAGDAASAKLTVQGQATVHTLIHYKDANSKDVYVKLADKDKIYNELQDTMKRSDYLQSDNDLTIADRGLLPSGMIINYNDPTIRNSNNTYAAGYANGAAAFDKTAKYDFDGDQVIFEGAMPEIVTKTHQAKETIHYVYRDGSTAKPDKVLTSVTLKQTGYKNPFTSEITWDSPATDTLNSVDSPEITGYIADKLTVPSYTVTMDSPDKEVTVTYYYADNENADFTYFDDTTNSTLKVVNKSGKSNTSIGYTTTDEINNYEKHGYTLVSDDTNGLNLNFDSLPTIDQHYTIHLKHKTERVTRNDTVTRTIHYIYDNGDTAQPDKTQTVSFDEIGFKDDVTGKTTWFNDNAKFVYSVNTPSITGYTPDKSSIDGQTFKFGDKDVEVTVTYHANAQTATITYIDDTTETNLDSKDASGKFGQAITFETTPTDEIENYKKQGYVLVSNIFDNNKYQAVDSNNVFYVHLKHGTKDVSRSDDVNMTVHYVMDDNSEAPSDNKQTVNFTEDGSQDLVTKHIDWTPAASQTLKDVASPVLTGYTADIKTANGKAVNFGDPDINVTVTYHANAQTATITYIDDTTKTNLDSKDTSGKFGQAITFETAPADEIENYKKQGYVLVSNSFDNNKYQADDSNNVFYVHLKHDTKDVSRSDDVNMTVHYVMDDNSVAPSDSKQTVSFTENGIQDLVTKHIDWTPAVSQTFKDVATKSIVGYTPDQDNVAGQTVNFGDKDINVTVHYSANIQNAKITYIDDTTKTNLDSKDTSGKFGQAITFATAPADEIENYKKQGYVLVSNSFDNNKYQADNGSNVFYVHFVHGTKNVSRNSNVNMTVHYVMDDNSEAPSDNKQTLSFTENGIQDLVTKHIDWTPAVSQMFKDVATKLIVGYTPDKENVTGQTVNFGDKDINVTVHYNANMQTATITYIDDTTKTNLNSKETSGKFGQAITFATAPADEIENYKKQGYVLVSNSFDNQKYQADNSNNVFYVHLKHDTKDVSRNSNVNMTVHYVMDDNSEAPRDNKQTVSFTENGIQDLVTKHIDWTPAESQTLKDVDSPVLTGYTADIKTANGKAVNFGDSDINVTVHYSANTQTATITYIDDTEKKTLSSDNRNGKFNQVIAFEHDPAEVIKGFEEKGYVFVSSTFGNQKYQAVNSNNVFEVHFVHGTKNVSRNDDVKMTVHYVMDDNSKAPSDNKQTLSFTENGIQDLVTKHIDWTTANSQTFKDVVTPTMTGYTPDQDKVTGQTVKYGDGDVEVTVTYSPNVQLGHINYIDDDTKKTLTRDDFSGRTNEHEDYTSTDRIQEFENKGYELVSNDYPNGGFNFDNNDRQDQVFNVHFKHGIVTVTTKNPQTPNTPINPDPQSPKYPKDIGNTNSDVNRTIDYKFKNGKTAQPTVTDSLHFERTVVIDKVTGKVSSDTWTPSQNFSDIQTPVIQGYTPDRTSVSDKNIGHDHQDIIEHVVYSPDTQHMTITYIDDTTGETLHTDNPKGVSDQDAKYTTSDTIKKYEDRHYKLISDSTKGQDLIFDHDDDVDQTYEVHFVHGKHAIDQTTSPKQTIHYVYSNGLARQGKAADDNVQQLSFKRDGYNDEVTGVDHWNAWTPVNSQYEAVDSPVIQGYTPDKLVVEKSTVNPTDKDIKVTVTYSADKQAAHVIYVDKTTNTTLVSKDLSGKSDEDSEYNTEDKIGQYKSQHYVLFEDETNGKNVVFDHNDQQDQTYYVYFVHGTQKVNRQSTVTETIDYKFEDGKTAQPTVTQTKHFSENGVKDLVTNKITWDDAAPQKFEDVVTKSIVGYTPDKDNVVGSTVKFGDQDIIEHIVYHNNAQTAKITYIDDVTNQTLASDSQDGKFDYEVKFNNNPSDVISGFEKSGYKLVSSNFKDGTKYKADNKQNEFIVHLTHDMHSVSRQDKVIETIHYVYEDGSKVQPDHEQTISFNETGSKDLVTGKITWDEAKPQKFEDVATKSIIGYTPDTDNVVGSTVKFGDDDVEVTVRYNANAQTAKITYIDDTEKKTLNSDQQNGRFNQVITFEHDPAEVIKDLEEKGYELVSDDFKPGIKYQSDNKSNSFEVHLKHKTESVTRNGAVTRTIHYLYDDGNTAKPDKIQTVSFNETGTKDDVTGKTTWDNDDTQTVDSVITPSITGYTPDKSSIDGQTFKFGDKDVEVTVRYNANAQTATITYIDDTEKKTLGSDKRNGKFNQVITFEHDPAEAIKGLEEKGYKLISDNFKPGVKYQNDNKSNSFEVHLVHTYEPVETSQTITETVHYIDANGKPVAPDHVATVVVKVTGARDKVTDSITWNTSSTGHFDEVTSPVVPNMTPDKKFIPSCDVQYGDSDITENVVYTLDELPGEPGKSNKPCDSTPKTPENPNKPGDSTPKTPEKSNKPGNSTPKTPKKPNKSGNPTAKTPEKSNKSGKEVSKTSEKTNNSGKEVSKTPEKPNSSGKEVSKQRGTIAETTIPETHVDSRTADNQVSAKSTAKRELPQTGATTSTGVWTGLASIIASLGLLGASKRRKKN